MRPVQRCLLSVGLFQQTPARAKVTVSQRLYRALRDSPPDRIYRRIPSRLGSRTQRSGYQRTLEGPLGVSAYQLVGTEGGLSSHKALSAAAQGTACHSQNRQHRDSCLNQQAGGFRLPNLLQTGNSSVAMGSSTVQFTQGRSCARAPKRGGGHVVQRGTKSRRVETPPPGGRGNLVPIWQGGGRPVCDQRIFSLPTFLLPEERQSSSGIGCAGAPLAADPALCLPPINPPPSPSAQGTNGAGEANPGCTV